MFLRFIPFVIAAVLVALDRLTKDFIKAHVSLYQTNTIIPDLFNIVHTENPGIAFGMLSETSGALRDVLLIGFSSAVLVGITAMLLRAGTVRNAILRTALAFIQGLARQRTLLERRFFVVVPAESGPRLGWRARWRS